jgi:hypothetical protein
MGKRKKRQKKNAKACGTLRTFGMLPVNPLAQHALKRDAYHLLYFEEARELEDPQKPQRLDDFQRKGRAAVE